MTDRKANFLVTMIFDENSDIRKQVDAEIDFKDKIIKYLQHLVKGREIKHFIVADDAVINEKLNADVVERSKIEDAIIIPEGATNGDVIKAIFPNARVSEIYPSFNDDEIYYVPIEKFNGVTNEMRVTKSWWNAPYKKGEVKE